MRVCITYWYHSCFTIEIGDKVMLFDYPNRGIDASIDEEIKTTIDGSELYIFISHGHGDHFSPEVTKFSKSSEKTRVLFSDDISEKSMLNGHSELSDSVTFNRMEPGEQYNVDDMRVRTWKSNDAGLAFLIHQDKKKIYYGGDLAKWNWPEWNDKKIKEHVKIFDEVVKELRDEDIDIAFSNMDERLPSWAGPLEFIEKVNPHYFVPMHTFGNEGWIDDLINENINAKSEIFHYEKAGDEFYCEL